MLKIYQILYRFKQLLTCFSIPIHLCNFPQTKFLLLHSPSSYYSQLIALITRLQYKSKHMNCPSPQLNGWQMMYSKLLNDYSTLAYHYHQQSESNNALYQQLENLLQEKISLLQDAPPPPSPLPLLSASNHQEEAPSSARKPKGKETQKRKVRRHGMRRNGGVYTCTYSNCTRTYRSSVSMNLHIKIKHNGGTKKEREAYAKILIDSEEKGVTPPEIGVNLPPNFLDEFKQNYSYIKKYNM